MDLAKLETRASGLPLKQVQEKDIEFPYSSLDDVPLEPGGWRGL
jgi:hypothetical protein